MSVSGLMSSETLNSTHTLIELGAKAVVTSMLRYD